MVELRIAYFVLRISYCVMRKSNAEYGIRDEPRATHEVNTQYSSFCVELPIFGQSIPVDTVSRPPRGNHIPIMSAWDGWMKAISAERIVRKRTPSAMMTETAV